MINAPTQPDTIRQNRLFQAISTYINAHPAVKAIADKLTSGISPMGLGGLGTMITKKMLEQARQYVPGGTEIGWSQRVPAQEQETSIGRGMTTLYKPVHYQSGSSIPDPTMSRAVYTGVPQKTAELFRQHWWTSNKQLAQRVSKDSIAPTGASKGIAKIEVPSNVADGNSITNRGTKGQVHLYQLIHRNGAEEYMMPENFKSTNISYTPQGQRIIPQEKSEYGPPFVVKGETTPPEATSFIQRTPYGSTPGIYHAYRGAVPKYVRGRPGGYTGGEGVYLTMDPRYADIYARGEFAKQGEILHHVVVPVNKVLNMDDPLQRRFYYQQAAMHGEPEERSSSMRELRVPAHITPSGYVVQPPRKTSLSTLRGTVPDFEPDNLPNEMSPKLIQHFRNLGYDTIYSQREAEGAFPSMIHLYPDRIIPYTWEGEAPWEIDPKTGTPVKTLPGGQYKPGMEPQPQKEPEYLPPTSYEPKTSISPAFLESYFQGVTDSQKRGVLENLFGDIRNVIRWTHDHPSMSTELKQEISRLYAGSKLPPEEQQMRDRMLFGAENIVPEEQF